MEKTNLGEAIRKLTKAEYNLFLATEPSRIQKLSKKQIEMKLNRLKKKIDKLKTLKMSSKRLRKSVGLGTQKESNKKIKLTYLTVALKRLKAGLKDNQSEKKISKPVVRSASPKIRLANKTKPKKMVNVEQRIKNQNIKVNSKQSKFVKSGSERKLGHLSSQNRRSQGRKDSR